MATKIRTKLSKKNPYYISKERRLELVHFCLQYKEWEKELNALNYYPVCDFQEARGTLNSNPTSKIALRASIFKEKMEMVKEAAVKCDSEIGSYIFEAVITGKTYSYFEANGAPFSRDLFYDRLRKYFWVLDGIRM